MTYGFGIDVGGTSVKLGLFTQTGALVQKWEIPTVTEDAGSRILPDVAAAVMACLKEHNLPAASVLGIGVGIPGPVLEDGTVVGCVNLGWGTRNVRRELEQLTGIPVTVVNDANSAALGEWQFGSGQGSNSMVLATLGTGVGGGIVVNGKILSGAHGAGGEIGHINLNPTETEACNCGKSGCAEQYCSATGLLRLARRALEQTTPSTLRKMPQLTCPDIFQAAEKEDAVATGVLEQFYRYLAALLANICCVADPEIILLGGGVSKAGTPLVQGVTRHFRQIAFPATRQTKIALAQLGNDAGIYGAFHAAITELGGN